MKHLFLYLIIICNGFSLFAQSPFSVKFELVNPSGKIKSDSYFLFTLTNNTDSTYIFTKGIEQFGGAFHTYLVREIKFQTEIYKGRPMCSFDFRDGIIVLKPKESISIRISKFFEDNGNGALPYNKALLATVEKVRYTLVKLQYLNKDNPFAGLKTVDLVSNWVVIDTTEFARLIKTND